MTVIGLGFYALHNTLQTKATQMTPQARGTAVAVFSSASISDRLRVSDRRIGLRSVRGVPLFLVTAVALPALAFWFAHELQRRQPLI